MARCVYRQRGGTGLLRLNNTVFRFPLMDVHAGPASVTAILFLGQRQDHLLSGHKTGP